MQSVPPAVTGGSSANEVNDLEPIVIVERGSGPFAPAHDSTIQFNRDSLGRQLEFSY